MGPEACRFYRTNCSPGKSCTLISNPEELFGRTRLLFDLTRLALKSGSTRLITFMLARSTDLDTLSIASIDNTFADAVFTFSTGPVAPAGNIRIGVQEISATRIHIDNFRLDAIPEPSSLATLTLAAGLLMRRRRA